MTTLALCLFGSGKINYIQYFFGDFIRNMKLINRILEHEAKKKASERNVKAITDQQLRDISITRAQASVAGYRVAPGRRR